MRFHVIVACALFAGAAHAQDDPRIADIRAAWSDCNAKAEAGADGWLGWRRDFYNGYADSFEFHDGAGIAASMLRVTSLIDGIAVLTETSCYRPDGTLAFLLSEMSSPNIADGGYDGPPISREGRIYVAPDGGVIRVLTAIRADGVEVAAMDNDQYRLARSCSPAALYPATADVRRRLESELGDIVGDHPPFETQTLDWCPAQ